jgi:hypothetical protein
MTPPNCPGRFAGCNVSLSSKRREEVAGEPGAYMSHNQEQPCGSRQCVVMALARQELIVGW